MAKPPPGPTPPTPVDTTLILQSGYGTEKICATCLAYDAPTRECRRYPPLMLPRGQTSDRGLFPILAPSKWCLAWVAAS